MQLKEYKTTTYWRILGNYRFRNTAKKIKDGPIISSVKLKFDNRFFDDLCVLYNLWTWNYSACSANQKKNNSTYVTCTKQVNQQQKIVKFWLNWRNYGSFLYYFSFKTSQSEVIWSWTLLRFVKTLSSKFFWLIQLKKYKTTTYFFQSIANIWQQTLLLIYLIVLYKVWTCNCSSISADQKKKFMFTTCTKHVNQQRIDSQNLP